MAKLSNFTSYPGIMLKLTKIFVFQATFRCVAEANPPPFPDSYKWFLNDSPQSNKGDVFEITNISRDNHEQQVRCSVENDLGVAMGLKSIEVKCKWSAKSWLFRLLSHKNGIKPTIRELFTAFILQTDPHLCIILRPCLEICSK